MSTNADGCAEFRALASCRLDGELNELQVVRLERHLLACDACNSWSREIASLAGLLYETEPVLPAWSFEVRTGAVRGRVVRAATVGATAASAAALAAFAFVLPGTGISFFSTGSGHPVSAPPCTSCTKKQAITSAATSVAAAAAAMQRNHVANPLIEQE